MSDYEAAYQLIKDLAQFHEVQRSRLLSGIDLGDGLVLPNDADRTSDRAYLMARAQEAAVILARWATPRPYRPGRGELGSYIRRSYSDHVGMTDCWEHVADDVLELLPLLG